MASRQTNIWQSLDWTTILIYVILVLAGWMSIYAASYDFDNASMFDLAERSGKQMLWIGFSMLLGVIILMLDYKFFENMSFIFYGLMIALLIVTIFIAPDIKGSRSWIVMGPISLQPAEFAKFATALALAKLFNSYNFNLLHPANFIKACLIILLPMGLIFLQKETGSALVYAAFVLVLYREGMSGMVLLTGAIAVLLFVVGLKYSEVFWGITQVGEYLSLSIIAIVLICFTLFYLRNIIAARNLFIGALVVAIVSVILAQFAVPFNLSYLVMGYLAAAVIYLLVLNFIQPVKGIFAIILIVICSVSFLYSVEYVFNEVMEPHQQMRIKVSLGMEDDLRGAGYNVNQSKIAIGSGGFLGKGFLNGTQTKLKYVPEQDTDFIFCTIGEEQGFLGSAAVLILLTLLILRIIKIAERQRAAFGRVYGYSVASILFFHLAVNIGMVIGLSPVIGIPLPFFSYGGSSLWGFTILLFILLNIDAARLDKY